MSQELSRRTTELSEAAAKVQGAWSPPTARLCRMTSRSAVHCRTPRQRGYILHVPSDWDGSAMGLEIG
jgi:hypothetical protein